MLQVHRSASADVLVAELGTLLARPGGDPFAPDVVAVPAKGVERWLAQRLSHVLGAGADGAGICANVSFPSPARLLDVALHRAQGAPGPAAPADDPWTPERSTWPLLALFERGAASDAIEQPRATRPSEALPMRSAARSVSEQYRGTSEERERARSTAGDRQFSRHCDQLRAGDRRYAGAARFARLFAAYGQERPEMLRRWAAGDDVTDDGTPLPPELRWQAALWRALRAEIGTPSPAERLPAALTRLAAEPGLLDLPERFAVYGLTRLSTARLSLLAAIAIHRDVHVFLQHPSPALWSAVAAGGTARTPVLASMSRDAAALQRRLAAAAPGHGDLLHPHPPRPDTLLGALQDALAADALPPAADRRVLAAGDHSIAVHACHGRARQVDVLREVILDRLAADPTLEPRDVLVMCPDVEEFAPLVGAAFGLDGGVPGGPEAHPAARLRVRLADRALTQANPLLGTLATLLELSTGRISAADVLDLAASAPVRRRFGFDDDAVERMQTWVGGARITWGLDAEYRDRYLLGSISQGTWRDGLDRVLLGVTMEEGGHCVGEAVPLDDLDSADIDLAGRMAEFVDRLDVAVRHLSRTQSLLEWTEALLAAVLSVGAPTAGQAWQAAAVATELADLADTGSGHAAGTEIELSPADAAALLAGRLAGRPTRAGFRTGTLTVATMVPMRSVPHRVIVLLGLDDTTFPRSGAVDGDDLLARPPRRPGERDPRAEDRQLLLDAVCAAGEHLVVLYSGADERTGTRVPPAVPIGELLDALDDVAVAPGGVAVRDFVTTRHPLQPFDPRNFGVGVSGPGPAPVSFDVAALAGARAVLRPRTAPRPLVGAPLDPLPEADVELADLTDFLLHPAKGFLRQRLDVQAQGWYREPAVAVPIELNELAQWDVGDRVLAAHLRGIDLDECLRLESRRGTLPPHDLARKVGNKIRDRVDAIATLARPDTEAAADSSADIDLTLPGGRRLTGTVAGLRAGARLRVGFSSLGAKQRLSAWVDLLALSAAWPEQNWRSVTVARRKDAGIRHVLATVDAELALGALAELVAVRDEGLREPLPMPLKTTCAYTEVRNRGGGESIGRAARVAAEKQWDGGRFPGERDDAEHRLIWGAEAPFDVLDLDRLHALAGRVWRPLLLAEAVP